MKRLAAATAAVGCLYMLGPADAHTTTAPPKPVAVTVQKFAGRTYRCAWFMNKPPAIVIVCLPVKHRPSLAG